MIWPQKPADILFVEDDPKNVEIAMAAFRERNISKHIVRVVDASGALDFIAYLDVLAERTHSSLPRFILMNLHLRNANGMELLEQIKFHETTCHVPVVLFARNLSAVELIVSYKLGVNSCVIRPPSPEKFGQIVGDIALYWLNINQLPV